MTIQCDPPKSSSHIDIQLAWFRLLYKLNNEFIDTGWSNILFVDGVDGNDDNARRGSLTFAYATIQAALDAAQEGDVVWVGPGTFTEDLTWPVDVNTVQLRGAGIGSTTIQNATGTATLNIAPTSTDVQAIVVRDLSLSNDTTVCVNLDGSNDLDLGQTGVLFENVTFTTTDAESATFSVFGDLQLHNMTTGQRINISQYGSVIIRGGDLEDMALDNDPTGDVPTAGFGAVLVDSTRFSGDVTVANLAKLVGSDDVQIGGNLTATLTDTDDPANGSIMYSGRIVGNTDVSFAFGDTDTDVVPLILDQARLSGTLTFGATVAGAVQTARCNHAILYSHDNDAITADSEANIDLRGASFDQDALNSTDSEGLGTAGTIDRTLWIQEIDAGVANPNWGHGGGDDVPYPSAPSHVSFEVRNIADAPVAITAVTDTDVTISTTGTEDVVIVCAHREYD